MTIFNDETDIFYRLVFFFGWTEKSNILILQLLSIQLFITLSFHWLAMMNSNNMEQKIN